MEIKTITELLITLTSEDLNQCVAEHFSKQGITIISNADYGKKIFTFKGVKDEDVPKNCDDSSFLSKSVKEFLEENFLKKVSTRAYNRLLEMVHELGLETVDDLLRCNPNEFLGLRNSGKKSYTEAVKRFIELGAPEDSNFLQRKDLLQ